MVQNNRFSVVFQNLARKRELLCGLESWEYVSLAAARSQLRSRGENEAASKATQRHRMEKESCWHSNVHELTTSSVPLAVWLHEPLPFQLCSGHVKPESSLVQGPGMEISVLSWKDVEISKKASQV